MTILDTNVVIYASDPHSDFFEWSIDTISAAVAGEGATVNAVSLAEICVGERRPDGVADRIRRWGVSISDIPSAVSPVCARAFREYRRRRSEQSGKASPVVPLPDFFIGAHAEIMVWSIATADDSRFRTYFPSVDLTTPHA